MNDQGWLRIYFSKFCKNESEVDRFKAPETPLVLNFMQNS